MKNCVIPLIPVLILAASPSMSAGLEELASYGYGGYFTWREYEDSGRRILKERGPLFGAGVSSRIDLGSKALILQLKAELFGTVADYEGETQSATPALDGRPVESDARYFGGRIEGDMGWHLPSKDLSVEPFIGIGLRSWLRDIAKSTSTTAAGDRFPVAGATEYWDTVYSRYGMRVRVDLTSNTTLQMEGGAKYPLYTRNEARDTIAGDVTIEPRPQWSAFAEVALRHKSLRPAIFYEGFRFRRSHDEKRGDYLIWQPESESDVVGFSLTYLFH